MKERNLEEVRREIELTRARLGEKISLLQEEVEIKRKTTLNPAYHMRTRPLQTFGITVLAGWMLGRMAKPKRNRRGRQTPSESASTHNGAPQADGRSFLTRAAVAGIRATASSLIVKDLVKTLVGDYVKRRWAGGSARREQR